MHRVVTRVAPVGAAVILLGALMGAQSPGCESSQGQPEDRHATAVSGEGPGQVMSTADGPDIRTIITGQGRIHIEFEIKAPAGSRWGMKFCDDATGEWDFPAVGVVPGGLVVTAKATGSGPLACAIGVDPDGPKVTGTGTGSVTCRLVTRG